MPLLLSKGSSCLGSKKKEREKKRKRESMEKGEEVRVWERGRTQMTISFCIFLHNCICHLKYLILIWYFIFTFAISFIIFSKQIFFLFCFNWMVFLSFSFTFLFFYFFLFVFDFVILVTISILRSLENRVVTTSIRNISTKNMTRVSGGEGREGNGWVGRNWPAG